MRGWASTGSASGTDGPLEPGQPGCSDLPRLGPHVWELITTSHGLASAKGGEREGQREGGKWSEGAEASSPVSSGRDPSSRSLGSDH